MTFAAVPVDRDDPVITLRHFVVAVLYCALDVFTPASEKEPVGLRLTLMPFWLRHATYLLRIGATRG